MSDEPFMRIWPGGGISKFFPLDRRAWPWLCALRLSDANHTDQPFLRDRMLHAAEWIAVHRRGYFRKGSGQFTRVVQRLVNTCDLCGKRGLYLQGVEGRCLEHRTVPEHYHARRVARIHQGQADTALALDDVDHHGRILSQLQQLHKGSKRSHRLDRRS